MLTAAVCLVSVGVAAAGGVNLTFVGGYDTPGWAIDVAVFGNYAYVADYENGISVVNISNPMAPILVGSCDTAGEARTIAIAGDYAYVADWNNGIVVMDINNPELPAIFGHHDTNFSQGIAVSGSLHTSSTNRSIAPGPSKSSTTKLQMS